jgi:hypothetical protein
MLALLTFLVVQINEYMLLDKLLELIDLVGFGCYFSFLKWKNQPFYEYSYFSINYTILAF